MIAIRKVMEVKSLRAKAYFYSCFFSFLFIVSNGFCSLAYRGFISYMYVTHRFLFLTVARLNWASLVSAVTHYPSSLFPQSSLSSTFISSWSIFLAPNSHVTDTIWDTIDIRYLKRNGVCAATHPSVSLFCKTTLYSIWFSISYSVPSDDLFDENYIFDKQNMYVLTWQTDR